jgi:hypothetical protein
MKNAGTSISACTGLSRRNLLALDPGTEQTGCVHFLDGKVASSAILHNEDVLDLLRHGTCESVACEMIASYGMPVGKEVFETCVWIGRFFQTWHDRVTPGYWDFIYRRDVKLHLCGSARAKDANIRQALLDRLGPQGTKKAPGPTYGVKSHAWAALAVAVCASDGITSA